VMNMRDGLSRLVQYDETTRQLFTQGMMTDPALVDSVPAAVHLLECLAESVFKSTPGLVAREIGEWARFRAIFCLLPEVLLFGDAPMEKKPIIASHLEALGVEPEPRLISAIKCLCEHFQSKRGTVRKLGISDVYVKYPQVFNRVLSKQNSRCCYCGEPIVYGDNATLDHIWPFHLGDDPTDGSNWCFCCDFCNRGKGEYPVYSITGTGANWISPDADGRLSAATRFAVLSRDRACVCCGRTPRDVVLDIEKRVKSGCWILDNCQAVCRGGCVL
jgi:hypothetical protein